ncbi:PREDICTED: mucin-5AC [Atta cephalotes]|uniref:EGF-like domain-containing protein n=1 Tax=Atta cephalotes TaxID=12957 RepID=A0A158N9J2_ATTCE|nr:PREDICTED: mucin-5AC [Atta cephalotes]
MRAIQYYVYLALLLMTASAVPASSKGDSAKVKKTTAITSGGGKNTSAITATTAASRPIANATLYSSSFSSAATTTRTTATVPQTVATSATTTLKLPASSTTITATATATTTTTTTSSASPSLTSSTASLPTSRAPQDGSSPTYITETSPRIISPTQHTAATVLSSRKSAASATAAVADVTTSAPLTAKETRESPGKIRPQIKLTTNYTTASETGVRLPEGASAALAKPTKYHYYPHNQHIYLLPECAVQQVCNAVYVRLNFTQPLCACPGRYRDPCSASLDSDDLHTTELVTDPRTKALTLVKTCEPVAEMRECRASRDWSLLALQNVRTGKSHYLVICRCPDTNILEGPMSHDQPTYASVPGIRVYGMMCVQGNRRGRPLRYSRSVFGHAEDEPRFPWDKVRQLLAMPSLWE